MFDESFKKEKYMKLIVIKFLLKAYSSLQNANVNLSKKESIFKNSRNS